MELRQQHLMWSSITLFACLMVTYGLWVVLASANGRALSFGEFLLGILALLGGSAVLCYLLRILYEQLALSLKKKRARSRPV